MAKPIKRGINRYAIPRNSISIPIPIFQSYLVLGSAFIVNASPLVLTTVTVSIGTINNGDQLFGYLQGVLCLLSRAGDIISINSYLPLANNISIPASGNFVVTSLPLQFFPVAANFTIPTSGSSSVILATPSSYSPPVGQKFLVTIQTINGLLVRGASNSWTFTPNTYPTTSINISATVDYFTVTSSSTGGIANTVIADNKFDSLSIINFKDLLNNVLGRIARDGTWWITRANIKNLVAKLFYSNATQQDDSNLSSFFTLSTSLGKPILRANPITGAVRIEKPLIVDGVANNLTINKLTVKSGLSAYKTTIDSLGNIFWVQLDSNNNRQIWWQNTSTGIASQLTTIGENYSPSSSNSPPGIVFFVSNRNGYDESYWADFNGSVGASVASPVFRFAGDSMPGLLRNTAATISGNLITARGFFDSAVGGQTSTENSALIGAIPCTCTVPGGNINASGATSVIPSIDFLRNGSINVQVSVQGIVGSISRNPAGNAALVDYAFTRSYPGASVAAPGTVPIKILNIESTPLGILYNGTWIIWTGHNDVIQVSLDQYRSTVLANISAIVSKLPKNRRFLVLSISPAGNGINPAGYRPKVDAANTALAASYGYNYFDQHEWCLQQCREGYNAGTARFRFPASSAGTQGTQASAQDQIFNQQVIPLNGGSDGTINLGWRGDSIHYNGYGFTALWNKIQSIILEKTW